jgi:hypothetical protein
MAATATATATIAESKTPLPIHRLDVDTYNQIVASGALEGQRVELVPHSAARCGTLLHGAAQCYTRTVPTTRPRHMITETPPVKEALDHLREKLRPDEKVDFGELVVLGAELKARRLSAREASDRAALKRLTDMIRTGSLPYAIDMEAAAEVKYRKLIPKYE